MHKPPKSPSPQRSQHHQELELRSVKRQSEYFEGFSSDGYTRKAIFVLDFGYQNSIQVKAYEVLGDSVGRYTKVVASTRHLAYAQVVSCLTAGSSATAKATKWPSARSVKHWSVGAGAMDVHEGAGRDFGGPRHMDSHVRMLCGQTTKTSASRPVLGVLHEVRLGQ